MAGTVRWAFAGPCKTDLEFTIDLTQHEGGAPLFAFATCDGHCPELGFGLSNAGRITLQGELGEREYSLLQVADSHTNREIKFKFDASGEYLVEIYYVSQSNDASLIFKNYFVCK